MARVPVKTPMFDTSGNLTTPWIRFFSSLDTSQEISDLSNMASLADDVAPAAFAAERNGEASLMASIAPVADGAAFAASLLPLAIVNGGTGAVTATAARTNLLAVSRTIAITAPSGGTTVDSQARTAIAAIIAALNA